MYKVFVNDHPIFLADAKKISTKNLWQEFNPSTLHSMVTALILEKAYGFYLYSHNLLEDWKYFKKQFSVQEAAGGKVLNSNGEVLFIRRLGKWDLPKGKLEQGETIAECAMREVAEECGIKALRIKEKLTTTYHIFIRDEKTVLKITYWFLMHTNFRGKLIPQSEEGIEKAEFLEASEVKNALADTYANIRLLF